MGSKFGGMKTPIFICSEMDNGKYYCSHVGITGVFHTKPKASELEKIAKIMNKYKCDEIKHERS